MNLNEIKFLEKHKKDHQEFIENKFGMTFEMKNDIKYSTLITLNQEETINLEANVIFKEISLTEQLMELPNGTNILLQSQ